ncbi:hypothetical protein K432DRAFT_307511 [Lepidopterella palustris CBS 459.81]|uniref:Uncharacterized protein n=1 Tax=Lepidopterella palustris CBS 459.81 TaxID=1314670 RepID=A0A8E2JB63_9PEZI|nr:hypothetical protein K432DRAFT_307511 [Lepidopterella palustris CBS 459.81]
MSLLRGIQSAIFHYVSCAPCTGYLYRNKRMKQAKRDRKEKIQLQMEQPELYHHPDPSSTNPYWSEEIVMGPGPPPRRTGRKANNGSQRGITTADTQSTVASHGGSSLDINPMENMDPMRASDDTLSGDNWNRRRYQREDEELWGFGEAIDTVGKPYTAGSSVGVSGITRPGTAKSSTETYYTVRAPPVNDLHPPVVSVPSPNAADNRWMLQPPPKAKIMNGKERATNRSRSGSGASSRVELNLQRQVSARQLKVKMERGETPEMPPLSRGSSYSNAQGQRHDRDPKAPRATPPSSRKKRRDTPAPISPDASGGSSGNSSDTIVHTAPASSPTPPLAQTPPLSSRHSSLRIVRVRNSRQMLSTVLSSGSPSPPSPSSPEPRSENYLAPPKHLLQRRSDPSATSSDSLPYTIKQRSPLAASDASSLNILQDLVSPRALLNSRFVSAPLVEAKIKLPEIGKDEETLLVDLGDAGWLLDQGGRERPAERDPRMRWSVDF